MNDPVLHVQMLGGFNLSFGGTRVPPIPSRPASSLLAFLILRRDRTHTRDLLVGQFWSDLPEDKAKRRLSNALWQINTVMKTVGIDELFVKTNATVGLDPGIAVEVDLEDFERRLDDVERTLRNGRRGVDGVELAQIVEIYQGDLLAGHYDEWIDDRRLKVKERYLAALKVLVQLNQAIGDYEQALRHAQAVVATEPLSEEGHRDVMRLYLLNGQPSAAERQYVACRKAMRDEFDIDPSPETEELLARIRQEASVPVPVSVPLDRTEVPFVGRSAERSALVNRINDVLAGKGGLVLVEGEPGIGKSRLVAEVANGAEWRDVQVLVGRHAPTSPLTPYEGLRDAIGPSTVGVRGDRLAAYLPPIWLKQASSVLEGLRDRFDGAGPQMQPALGPEDETWRTTESLAHVLLALGRAKATMVVLEDVHWSDDHTMEVLLQLGDRLLDSNVLIFLTYQRHEAQASTVWQSLRELEAKPGSSRHVLGPLEPDDVRQMAASELGSGQLGSASLARLTSLSGGNPYVILEMLRSPVDVLERPAGAETTAGGIDGGGAEWSDDDDLLPGLLGILTHRINATSAEVRAVLEAVSAIPGPSATNVIAGVVGMERPQLVSAVAEAVELGFLVESPRGCEFAQEHTRRVVYQAIDPEGRRRIHGRIADSLVRTQGFGAGQMAHHAWLAGQWQRAHQYHALAADAALKVNAYPTTAEHFAKADEAAAMAAIPDLGRIDDLFAFERVLDTLGRRVEQQALLDRIAAAAAGRPAQLLVVGERQAWLLAHTDRGADAAQLATDALGPARQAGLAVGELLTIVGCARAWSGDLHGAVAALEEAVAEQAAADEPGLVAQLMLGRTYADLLQYERAQQQLETAHDVARAVNDPRSQVEALGHLATLYHSLKLEVKAEHAFRDALELARAVGYRHGEGLNLANLARFQQRLGRGGRAVALFAEAVKVFDSLHNGRGVAFVKMNSAELAHWVLGDDVSARSLAQEAAVYFRSARNPRLEALCLTTLASIDRRAGRRRLARRRLRDAKEKARSTDDPAVEALAEFGLALAALDLGHAGDALEHVEVAERLAIGAYPELVPVVLAAGARARQDAGLDEGAVELATRAIALNRPGVTLAHLAAWWCSGVLAASGDAGGAADQVALAFQFLARNLADLPEATARSSWMGVAEHRAILEARERYFVRTEEHRLPRAEAPTGRPLDSDEMVDVVWTLTHPSDASAASAADRRQLRILRLTEQALAQGAVARVSDLARVLDVSERTIKRDLAQLRNLGHQPVTRGSADDA